MIFLKGLEGSTLSIDLAACDTILALKQKIAKDQGISVEDQRICCAGYQLEDTDGLQEESTYHLSLRLLGGAKKRKKKVYNTPKKIKRKRTKVKLSVLNFYEVDDKGKIHRLRKECAACGGGVFMADHKNRHTCGRCHITLIAEQPAATTGKGKKK